MANAQKGEVALKAGEQTFTLVFNFNSIAEIETYLDIGITEIMARVRNPSDFRITIWRVLLWGALRHHHRGLSLEDAGLIIGDAGVAETIQAVGNAMTLAFPDNDGKPAENPQVASS